MSSSPKITRAVITCVSAIVLLAKFSGQIRAQEADNPLSAGELVAAYEESDASCVKSGYEGVECSKSNILERQLMDLGLCRLSVADPVFKNCQTYRGYSLKPTLNGYNFGFEESAAEISFSTEFTSYMPQLDGTRQEEKIGQFAMVCTSGKSPLIIVEIEADYPNFVIRDDKINFIASLEGYGDPSMARAIAGDGPTKGVFYIDGSEIVPKVLQFYSLPISALSGLSLTMKLTAYDPEATLELRFMPLWFNYEAMTRPTEMAEQLQAMAAACS